MIYMTLLRSADNAPTATKHLRTQLVSYGLRSHKKDKSVNDKDIPCTSYAITQRSRNPCDSYTAHTSSVHLKHLPLLLCLPKKFPPLVKELTQKFPKRVLDWWVPVAGSMSFARAVEVGTYLTTD